MSDLKSANLARIRDNQRRSRARRKEYLHELETKYRACQQRGVEASAEVQAAARKVLDENKRLRALLRENGLLSDAEIDAYQVADTPGCARLPSPSPADALEELLRSRKPGSGEVAAPESQLQPLDHHHHFQRAITIEPAPQLHHQRQRLNSFASGASTPRSNVSPVSLCESGSSYTHYFPTTPPDDDVVDDDDATQPGTFPHLSYQYDLAPHSPWPMAPIPQTHHVDFGQVAVALEAADLATCQQLPLQVDCPVPSVMLYEFMEKYNKQHRP